MEPLTEKVERENEKYKAGLARTLALSMAISIILCFVFMHYRGIKVEGAYRIDSLITSTVVEENGTRYEYPDGYMGPREKGSTVTLHVRAHKKLFDEPAALCFDTFNSELTLLEGDQVIYHQEYDPKRLEHQIGHQSYMVPLSENYNDGELEIQLYQTSDNTDAAISDIWIYPATAAAKFSVIGHEFDLILFSTVIVISFGLLVFFLVRSVQRRKLHQGVWLALFTTAISFWYLGFTGSLYYMIGDWAIRALMEYFMIFFAPVPMSYYLAGRMIRPLYRKIGLCTAVFFNIYFLTASVLNFSPLPLIYTNFLTPLHVMIAVAMVMFIVFIYTDINGNTLAERILRVGMSIGIFSFLAEIIRILANQVWGVKHHFLNTTIASLGILIIVVTLLLSFGSEAVGEYNAAFKRRELERMAYLDSLTGAPNRTFCYEELDRMEEEGKNNFTALFFDVNNLKYANDVHGHEVGDRLIQTVAKILKDAIGTPGFYGRWGGDEFIACVEGGDASGLVLQRMESQIREVNDRQEFPFKVSVAFGQAESTAVHPLKPMDAIGIADDRMYQKKKEMKDGSNCSTSQQE